MPGEGSGAAYPSAAALGEDLRRYLAGEPISARPVTRLERAVKWARRRPAIAALLGIVTLVTALGLGGVLWQWREAVLARGIAERESERAKAQSELAEQRLYDVRMNLVQRYWEDYRGDLVHEDSPSSFQPTMAASIAGVSSGSTGNESSRWGT